MSFLSLMHVSSPYLKIKNDNGKRDKKDNNDPLYSLYVMTSAITEEHSLKCLLKMSVENDRNLSYQHV